MTGHRFKSSPSRCFAEGSCPTTKNAFGIREVAFFLPLVELDTNSWTSSRASAIRPTGPPPFTLDIDFFVGYHLHSYEHGILNASQVKRSIRDIEGEVGMDVHEHRSQRYASTRV